MMEDNTKYSGQHSQNDLTHQQSEWSSNKNPYSQFNNRRNDTYPTLSVPTYSCYETPVVHDPCTGLPHLKQHSADNYNLNWFNPITPSSQVPTIQSLSSSKVDNDNSKASYDIVLPKRSIYQRQQQQVRDYENYLPYASQPEVNSQHTSFTQPHFVKGRILDHKFHPRYKSAHARLSPYPEQHKETGSFQTFLSPPIVTDQALMDQGPLMLADSFESRETTLNQEKNDHDSSFQFDIELHAPTAVMKKQDEQPVTYLNRGQAYLIDFTAKPSACTGTLTSTLSIAFHEPSHRQIAGNYWKYWISQQEDLNEARAIDLDRNQTTGVYNIRLISFDRIAFDWQARFGAKVYVRFSCLSTDFSRIKGVKGIPMRAVVETSATYLTMPNDLFNYKGTFQKLSMPADGYEYKERCYCKIKLFRDKGAERKNKDDKKQLAKQMDKIIASTNGNPKQHPLWPTISRSHSLTSSLTEVPSSPDITIDSMEDLNDILISAEKMIPPLLAATSVSVQRKRSLSDNQEQYRNTKAKLTNEDVEQTLYPRNLS
ncbi:Grainyhead-like protein 2 [Choanephora cucurbitarum]|uniref:Grainyhead-like protein 2 n=1 Tax=Choanephora cucurbitarum TaxID=101091 RepID=A0A1C7NGT6_9FUNG|nr:Grainyhead-like protein 2 [Choanephora cucurbitarum]